LTSSARADVGVAFFDGFLDNVAESCRFVGLGVLLGLSEADVVFPAAGEADGGGDEDADVVGGSAELLEALPCWQAASPMVSARLKTAAPDDAAARRRRDA
jgi:hypothetical protein